MSVLCVVMTVGPHTPVHRELMTHTNCVCVPFYIRACSLRIKGLQRVLLPRTAHKVDDWLIEMTSTDPL
jgi:hypothetical protein